VTRAATSGLVRVTFVEAIGVDRAGVRRLLTSCRRLIHASAADALAPELAPDGLARGNIGEDELLQQ
jgi:hypothetical protein